MKKILSLIMACLLIFAAVSCGNQGSSETDGTESGSYSDATSDTSDVIDESPVDVVEKQIIADRTFKHGFNVQSQTDGIPTPIGVLRTDETDTVSPLWNIGQWYCGASYKDDAEKYDSYNILNAKHSLNGSKHTWIDASKKLSVDTETGSIGMRLLGTKEYTHPRQKNEGWPHLLLSYNILGEYKLSELKSVRFEMEFMLTKLTNAMSASEQDNNLHTAQFVFYCVLRNTNKLSKDYNSYLWFGLNLFDARYEIIPAYASQDSGKEINTGAFIYQPISSAYCKMPTRLGETQSINYNLLPRMKDAFKTAQQARFLVNTKWEDLSLKPGNFGFEVTGTYDIAAEISALNLYAGT